MAQSGDTIELTLSGDIFYESFLFKQIEETGEFTQVKMISTLKTMILSGSEDNIIVSESWENCSTYDVSGVITEECESSTLNNDEGLILRDALQTISVNVAAGDNIVLPLPQYDAVFVQLNADDTVTILTSGKSMEGKTIQSWSKASDIITIDFSDGSKISYTPTQNYEGVTRVIGIYENGPTQKTVVGALAIDQKIDTSNLAQSDVSGNYKTVLASTNNQSDILYSFGQDGFGGFDSMIAGNTHFTAWGWSFTSGLIEANRYRTEDGTMIQDESQIQACQNGTATDCVLHQKRTYKVLGQTGNRYTMMRTLEFYFDENGVPEYSDVSVWTFYKQ